MIHLARRAVLLAATLVLLAHGDAFAATKNVSIVDFSFTPSIVKLKIGDTVTWTNNGQSTHTSTGDSPFSLWHSPSISVGSSYSMPFDTAGIYPYHCSYHLFMKANVGVKGFASPPSGVAGTTFTINVSTIPAPAEFLYDIQRKSPGGNWSNWMIGDTLAAVTWDSTGRPTGVYQFRSRLRRASDGSASLYSPATSVTVT